MQKETSRTPFRKSDSQNEGRASGAAHVRHGAAPCGAEEPADHVADEQAEAGDEHIGAPRHTAGDQGDADSEDPERDEPVPPHVVARHHDADEAGDSADDQHQRALGDPGREPRHAIDRQDAEQSRDKVSVHSTYSQYARIRISVYSNASPSWLYARRIEMQLFYSDTARNTSSTDVMPRVDL